MFSSTGTVQLVHRMRTRLILSEKPSDGTVAMHYGDEDYDFLAMEDYLPTLPNTVSIDCLRKPYLFMLLLLEIDY